VAIAVGLIASRAGLAHAEEAPSRLSASGFVGIDYFGDNIQLGNSWAPEQIPGTSVVVGARLNYLVVPAIRGSRLQFAVEGELAISPAFTGDNLSGTRMSYFSPVFGWRGHGMLKFAFAGVQPFVVLGAGGATVASTSPFMTKETDPMAYYGVGATSALSDRWQLRLDLRHGVMPAREGSATSTIELHFGIGASFGLPREVKRGTTPPPPPRQPKIDETDTDEDAIPDWLDNCPRDAETVNGVADEDGCPEQDPDGDGMIAPDDRCPDEAEDVDQFEDTDGCPDLDNDRDGVADPRDACPIEAETRNGFADADGCPDVVPPAVTAALTAAAVKFEGGRARVTDPAKRQLAKLLAVLSEHRDLEIAVTGHPDKAGNEDLARRRADAVKWHLVDLGIAEARITSQVGLAGKVPVDVALVISPPP